MIEEVGRLQQRRLTFSRWPTRSGTEANAIGAEVIHLLAFEGIAIL
jgi:hypothetical protein